MHKGQTRAAIDPALEEEIEETILYSSPPLRDREMVFENNQHHPLCREGHVPAGCPHWIHQPWRR